MNRPIPAWTGLLVLALLVLTGCTGIPASSAPEVVRTVPRSPATDATQAQITPQPGQAPKEVVQAFVAVGVDADAGYSAAKQFLTTGAARRWQYNQTVILSEISYGDAKVSGDTALVPVRWRRIGQLDAGGVFTSVVKGMGAGDEEPFDFHLTRVAGQWRIDQPPPEVLVNRSAFFGSDPPYHQYPLYFFDSQKVLVPDLRYSSLTGQALASWLLTGLLAGPRPELTQALISAVPAQVGKPTVQIGNPTIVEMPGTARLLAGDRNDLAEQLAYTLGHVPFSDGQLELTDSGKPVRIPVSSSLEFSEESFPSAGPGPGGALYFVRDGALFKDDGTGAVAPEPGQLGQPGRNLSAAAVQQGSGQSLQVAALTGGGQLLIGNEQSLTPSRPLPQPATSRPEWQSSENVWIGAGSHLYRAAATGSPQPVSLTSQAGPPPTGTITAVRLSPDGDRVALVIRSPNGFDNAWIGSVVTSASDVRIDSLEPLTPLALEVTDLSWANTTKLLLVAAEPGAGARVWQFYSDGFPAGELSNTNLRATPTAIAAQDTPQGTTIVVVSAGRSIWKLTGGGSWTSLDGTDTPASGTNPVFAS